MATNSRAFSVVGRHFAKCSGNLDFYEMQQAKGFFYTVQDSLRKDSEPWVGLELDLEDVYLNTDKEDVTSP